MATNNCASKTYTPFLTYLYEVERVNNATLTGVGTGRVTHMGKAKYIFLDDDGEDVIVDDHGVIVCLNLPSRILSVPSWALQLEDRYGKQDKTSIKSAGEPTWIRTNRNRVKRTISHHDQKGIPIIRARLANDTSYTTFSA
jgi:hypothetical protein